MVKREREICHANGKKKDLNYQDRPTLDFNSVIVNYLRFQNSLVRGKRSVSAWMLGSRVRVPLKAWLSVTFLCFLCCPV